MCFKSLQFEASIENMLKAIEQGVVTNSTVKRLKELEEKQAELERKILFEQIWMYVVFAAGASPRPTR